MFASGSLSLHPTGGSSSSFPFPPTRSSYRSPPRISALDSRWTDYQYPSIHLSPIAKIIDASLVLKGMASSDDEKKHDAPPALVLPPLKAMGAFRTGSPSPATSAATSIAAMSLSFIINDDTENTPANYGLPAKENDRDVKFIFQSDAARQTTPLETVPVPVPAGVAAASAAPPVVMSAGFGVNSILNTVCAKPECYRTIRGPLGSFCKYHKQSRFCRADHCNKSAKTGGYCISHGGGKRCSFEDCSKSAKQGGLCISHGGGKRCSEDGCTKSALVGGFCSAHGGGRKCKTSDCAKTALLGGYCIAHGGGKRCQVDGCVKSAVGGSLCVSHGGGKRCQTDGCDKGAVRNGVCIRHGAKRDGATSSNASGSPSPSPVKSVKGESEYNQFSSP